MASKSLRNLIAFLSSPTLRLSEYCVFQNLYSFNDVFRTRAFDLADDLARILRNPPSADSYATFLLWGDSGVGKTFLIKQVHREIGKRVRKPVEYRLLPLHRLTEKKLESELKAINRLLTKRK